MRNSLSLVVALFLSSCSSSFVYRAAPIDSTQQSQPFGLASRLHSSVEIDQIDNGTIELLVTIRNSSGQRIAIAPEAIEVYGASRSFRHRVAVISPLRYLEELKERNEHRVTALQARFHRTCSSATDSAQDLETAQQLAAIHQHEHAVYRKALRKQALSEGQEVQGFVYAAIAPRSSDDTLIVRIPTAVDTPSFRFVKVSPKSRNATYEREAEHTHITPRQKPGT